METKTGDRGGVVVVPRWFVAVVMGAIAIIAPWIGWQTVAAITQGQAIEYLEKRPIPPPQVREQLRVNREWLQKLQARYEALLERVLAAKK